MKEVKAYIRRERVDTVVDALAQVDGLSGISVCKVTGFGRSRGILQLVDYDTHTKIEVACSDELKDTVVQTILAAAHTGKHQDGKVYVTSLEEAWRIETREVSRQHP